MVTVGFVTIAWGQEYKLRSPNKKIELLLFSMRPGQWGIKVNYGNNGVNQTAIPSIALGLSGDQFTFYDNLRLVKYDKLQKVTAHYLTLHGKRRECNNEANEVTIHFKKSGGEKVKYRPESL